MRAVGAPFTLGTGAHPLIARLRQHVVPPQPPKLFSIRVQGGFSCSLLPFAVQYISDQITTEIDWCRVVGPRGRSTKSKFPTNNLALAPCHDVLTQGSRAGQGRAGQDVRVV